MRLSTILRRGVAVLLSLCILLLAGCAQKPVAIPAPEEPAPNGQAEHSAEEAFVPVPGSVVEAMKRAALSIKNRDGAAPAEPEAQEATGGDSLDGLLVGICVYSFSDTFMEVYRNELERCLMVGGADMIIMDAQHDQALQLEQIYNLVAVGVDVLVVNLVDSGIAPIIADLCRETGIPVVFISRSPGKEEIRRWADEGIPATYIGVDAAQGASLQAELLLGLPNRGDANGDGAVSVVMVAGYPGSVEAQLRTESFYKAMLDGGVNLEVLYEGSADWMREKAMELAENALVAYGDQIDVFVCGNDLMALGVRDAIEAAGFAVGEDLYLVGIDGIAEAIERVEHGYLTGTVLNDPFAQARVVAETVGAMARGEPVEPVYLVDYVPVTRENAPDVLASFYM